MKTAQFGNERLEAGVRSLSEALRGATPRRPLPAELRRSLAQLAAAETAAVPRAA